MKYSQMILIPELKKQLFLQYLRVRSEKSKMNLILELKKHFAYHDEKFPDLKEIFPGVL